MACTNSGILSSVARYEAKRKPRKCPACGAEAIAEITYGLPGPDVQEDGDEGRVVLGGCMVSEHDPAWQCRECKTQIFRANAS